MGGVRSSMGYTVSADIETMRTKTQFQNSGGWYCVKVTVPRCDFTKGGRQIIPRATSR